MIDYVYTDKMVILGGREGCYKRKRETERDRSCKHVLERHVFSCIYCIGTTTLCVLSAGPGGCLPRQDAFGRALFALLATCAADPTLEGGLEREIWWVDTRWYKVPSGDSRNLLLEGYFENICFLFALLWNAFTCGLCGDGVQLNDICACFSCQVGNLVPWS